MTLTRHEPDAKPAQHRRSPWIALVLLIALAITMAGIFPFRQILAQQRQVALTEAKLEALRAENRALEDEIGLLHTPQEIERLAREELGLVRKGEVAYTIELPERRPPIISSGVESSPESDTRSLWQRIWDFLTGRDLLPDG